MTIYDNRQKTNNLYLLVPRKVKAKWTAAAKSKGKTFFTWFVDSLNSDIEFELIDDLDYSAYQLVTGHKLFTVRMILPAEQKAYWKMIAKESGINLHLWIVNKLHACAQQDLADAAPEFWRHD